MTALIGRIPVRGRVEDPVPFKLIVGRDNLAANGLTIPHLDGMIWSGTAVGDWTLSCVSGRLASVTFVFSDGTVRTVASDSGEAQLGWISDDRGMPCVSGERITNAASFLSKRIAITAAQAAAEAAAAAQTTTGVSAEGTGTSRVTGDIGPYVLGKSVAGGTEEISRWLLERERQSFDAVFVPPGVRLAVHVDQELHIDYDPSGRKLSHVTPIDPYRRARLD
jgi:integrating conjugative element protein (TIGR03752 family)